MADDTSAPTSAPQPDAPQPDPHIDIADHIENLVAASGVDGITINRPDVARRETLGHTAVDEPATPGSDPLIHDPMTPEQREAATASTIHMADTVAPPGSVIPATMGAGSAPTTEEPPA